MMLVRKNIIMYSYYIFIHTHEYWINQKYIKPHLMLLIVPSEAANEWLGIIHNLQTWIMIMYVC